MERESTLLALVDSLQPLFGGGVALLTILQLIFHKYAVNQVVVLVVAYIVFDRERIAFEGGISMDLKHFRAQLL